MQPVQDNDDAKMFHPALDIKNGILVFGFRIKDDNGRHFDRYIVKKGSEIFVSSKSEIKIGETSFSIDKRNRLLPKLSHKWGADSLNAYLNSYADPSSNPVSEKELYEKIKATLKKHIELDEEADYSILVAWAIGTYFFPVFSAYPYLHIKAPKGSGKSQSLNFLKQVAFNAAKGRVSLPAFRDTLDSMRGTYIMDQADILNKDTMADFLDMLTDSYKRGGGEQRKMVAVGRDWEVSEFETYGPKAFASIRQLPEDLRDRCIVIPLIKSPNSYPVIDEESPIWLEIRDALYKLLLEKFMWIGSNYKIKSMEYEKDTSIVGRPLELWLPIETILIAMIASSGEIEAAKKRFLARYDFASYHMEDLEVAVIETVIELIG